MTVWKILNILRHASNGAIVEALVEVAGEVEGVPAAVRAKASFVANPDSPDFIPVDQVTEDVVIGWAKEVLGEAVMEWKLVEAVQALGKQTHISGLPWSAQ